MKSVLQLDYATLNFEPDTVSIPYLERTLLGKSLCFEKKGLNDGSPFVSPFGLCYLPNSGYSPWPHRLQISGVGCAHFEQTLPALYFAHPKHVSRLDFAFDVVVPADRWTDFIKYAFNASLDSVRDRKQFVLTGTGAAMTIYIGSRKSAKFCRIYNKSLEDPNYKAVLDDQIYTLKRDSDGKLLEYVIRYELEIKRIKQRGELFDPAFLLDSYFGDGADLIDFVKSTWSSFGEDFLLPSPVSDWDFSLRFSNKIFNLDNLSFDEVRSSVADSLYNSPQSYASTVDYLVDRFGKYIPFIVANIGHWKVCLDKCERYCGFRPDVICSTSEFGLYDLDIDDEYENPWSDDSSSCVQIDIDNL